MTSASYFLFTTCLRRAKLQNWNSTSQPYNVTVKDWGNCVQFRSSHLCYYPHAHYNVWFVHSNSIAKELHLIFWSSGQYIIFKIFPIGIHNKFIAFCDTIISMSISWKQFLLLQMCWSFFELTVPLYLSIEITILSTQLNSATIIIKCILQFNSSNTSSLYGQDALF